MKKSMKKLNFKSFEEFSCKVADRYDELKTDDELNDIAIIAKYEEARKIIRELLCIGYDLCSIEIHDKDWNKYDAEYIISIYRDEILCEPMLRDTGYIIDESSVMYVLDNCSSKVIPYCQGDIVYEVSIIKEKDNCDKNECDDNKRCTKFYSNYWKASDNWNKYTYTVNGNECDKETYEKALNEFNKKYLDDMQDMLLNYFDLVNEMNQWHKLHRLLW